MNVNQDKTNILLLFWGRKGGGAKYSYEICRKLLEREDVNLAISVSNQCDLIDEFKGLNCPSLIIDTYESVPGFIQKWVFQRYAYRNQLTSFLKRHRIDLIVIGMDFFWGDVIYKSARKAGAKTIFVVHEAKPHPGEPLFMGLVKSKTLNTLIRGADHLVALNDHVKEYLRVNYHLDESDVSVIPHGIFAYYEADIPKRLPDTDKEPIILLYFGAITYYKGLDILLKAFSVLEKRRFPVKLEIWGSGNLDKYANLISGLENIHIENRWIDEDEVGVIFQKSHICVLPYRDVSQSGIVGGASKAGLPIVACPAKGLKEQAGADAILFSDSFAPESLANAIENLIQNPKLYTEISRRLIEDAKKLDWAKIADDIKTAGDNLTNTNVHS